MSIVFAAITPHPPLLIPLIGKENLARLKDTQNAFNKLAEELKKNQVDTILIISPHGEALESTFVLNQNTEYVANFEEFGDCSSKKTWAGNLGLAQLIKATLKNKNSLHFFTDNKLDHGAAVPLFLLTEKLKDINIIPMNTSGLDNKKHFEFGQKIQAALLDSRHRVGIIASGDLSHRLSPDAPGGFSARGAKFDNKLLLLLKKQKTQDILDLPDDLIEEAEQCGLKSILILLGLLDGLNHTPQVLAYESPFGVGYLTMNFIIKN
ncbi:AmmeMemoRadiSam system protein B [Candidatus Parcubacteria bacterium]|nr:AmmeMemoRadiSam system protein B [Candidatus Parcubacteria bacterium]